MNKFVITIPTFNAEQYIKRALSSALNQEYSDFRIIVVDDCSTDITWREICNMEPLNATLIRRNKRCGVLANHYIMAQLCEEEEIIVNLDGDDELAHPQVLQRLDQEYADPNVWVSYGSYEYDYESRSPVPGSSARGIASRIPADRHDRSYFFCCSHLRSYKKWLFTLIEEEDLKIDGEFYQLAMDHALMWPMIEMAGPDHARYIDDILYLYNDRNPLGELNLYEREKVLTVARSILAKPRYPVLDKL